ncbi:hypothetical protein [Poriferisphaera sp. WC338]|uniref:hypothetical protein n=1 Tax=Poriferisphaera sp. WC338 TaxID=3425129 RepID=UPI003D8156A1
MKYHVLRGRLKRRGGWKQRVLWVLLGMIFLSAGVLVYMTRPERLGRLCAQFVTQATGAAVNIDKAYLTKDGRIELEDMKLWVPGRDDDSGRLVEIEGVVIDPDLLSIVAGSFRVESIQLLRPTIYVTEDVDLGKMNYQLLAEQKENEEKEQEQELPEKVPTLTVRQAELVLGEYQDGKYTERSRLDLEGRVSRKRQALGAYYFVLKQIGEGEQPEFQGEFNLKQHEFEVSLKHFSFTESTEKFLTSGMRSWWDRLQPVGEVTEMRIGYDPTDGLFARVGLTNGRLTIPFEQFPAKLSDVDLMIELRDDRIEIEKLTGMLGAGETTTIRYGITGEMQGLKRDDPFVLRVQTDPFRVTGDPEFILGMPPEVQNQYDLFTPSGDFRASAIISRKEPGGEITYDGNIDFLDVSGAYKKFPYPLEHVKGTIQFENNLLTIEKLAGQAIDGGDVVISGTVRNPGPLAETKLHIEATEIDANARFVGAMEEKHQKIINLFRDQAAAETLVQTGLTRKTESSPGDVPVFWPGGRISLAIDLYRPPGYKTKPQITTDIDLQGARVLYKHWPYPVVVEEGHVILAPGNTRIKNLTAHGLSGGEIHLEGQITKLADGKTQYVDLKVDRTHIPSDAYLYASAPNPQREWLKQMNLTGSLLANGEVKCTLPGKVYYAINFDFDNNTMRPFDSGMLMQAMRGSATLEPTQLTFHSISGKHDASGIDLDGTIGWGNGQLGVDLNVQASNLEINKGLIDVVPPELEAKKTLASLMGKYQPTGTTDLLLSINHQSNSKALEYKVTLRPQSLGFEYGNNGRLSFDEMSGELIVSPGMAELDELGGRFDGGKFRMSGFVEQNDRVNTALNFDVMSDFETETVRRILPKEVRDLLEHLSISGGFEIEDGRFVLRDEASDHPQYEFDSKIRMEQGQAKVGASITGFDGTVHVKVTGRKDEAWPKMMIDVDADRMLAEGRLIQPFAMELLSTANNESVYLKDFYGEIYGGTLVGEGKIDFGAEELWQFDLKLHDVSVDAFLKPEHYNDRLILRADARDEGVDVKLAPLPPGELSASLHVEQPFDKPEEREGRGILRVRDATLYNAPLTLAVLQVANLTLPTSQSFDRASARYVIDGEMVYLDTLVIESPSIAIIGDGTMDWHDMGLDLEMMTRNPAAPDLGALSDLFNVFKDELGTIQVRGTLTDPKAELVPLTGLRDSWESVFGSTKARGESRSTIHRNY